MKREYTIGPLFVRACMGLQGGHLPGHVHEFDHVTFCRDGWLLVRTVGADGIERTAQLAAVGYRPPAGALRPIRFPDIQGVTRDPDGMPVLRRSRLDLRFIEPGALVPEGATEILFDAARLAPPLGYWLLIPRGVWHEIVVLSESGGLDCTFPHRDHTGRVVEQSTGWEVAYS